MISTNHGARSSANPVFCHHWRRPVDPERRRGQEAAAIRLELPGTFRHNCVMKQSSASRAGIAAAILVLAGGGILQWRYTHKLRGELVALRNELAQAREESAQLKQGQTTTQVEARPVDHGELLRLRNRIAELGRELRRNTTDVRHSQAQTKTTGATESESQITYPFLKTAVTNRVPYGQTLVVGGWTSPTGKRAFVFATPALQTTDRPQPGIHLSYHAVQADESFWEKVGWGTLRSEGDDSVAGLLPPAQAEALLQALKQTKEAEVSNLSHALDGQATFAWTTTDGGGSTLLLAADILARPTPDRQFVDLELRPAK